MTPADEAEASYTHKPPTRRARAPRYTTGQAPLRDRVGVMGAAGVAPTPRGPRAEHARECAERVWARPRHVLRES